MPKQPKGPTGKNRGLFPISPYKSYRALLWKRLREGRRLLLQTLKRLPTTDGQAIRRDIQSSPTYWVRVVALVYAAYTRDNPLSAAVFVGYVESVDRKVQGNLNSYIKTETVATVPVFETALDRRLFEVFAAEQIKLINASEKAFYDGVSKAIVDGLEDGTSVSEIASIIEERYGVARSRAELIAENEIGTLNAKINQLRQTRAGISRFKWSSSGDSRVRPIHDLIDGNVYDWQTGHPTEGRPGEPIRCRCVALPVFE